MEEIKRKSKQWAICGQRTIKGTTETAEIRLKGLEKGISNILQHELLLHFLIFGMMWFFSR